VSSSLATHSAGREGMVDLDKFWHNSPLDGSNRNTSKRRRAWSPTEFSFVRESAAIQALKNWGGNYYTKRSSGKSGGHTFDEYRCQTHVDCQHWLRLYRRLQDNGSLTFHIWQRGEHSIEQVHGRNRGIHPQIRDMLVPLWEGGMRPSVALGELMQRTKNTVLQRQLPSIRQVHHLWDTLRRRLEKCGFHSLEEVRSHSEFQLPRDLGKLRTSGKSDFLVVNRQRHQDRWSLAFLCPSMVERIGEQVNVVRPAGCSVALSADGTHGVITEPQQHVLIIIGTHRLAINREGNASHTFVPLIFQLCDSESCDNYVNAFAALDEIAEMYFSQKLQPDVVRGDHAGGLQAAKNHVWPHSRFSVCRVHCKKRLRDFSRTLNTAKREIWLNVWKFLSQCGSEKEFDALAPIAETLWRDAFGDVKAANNLRKEWMQEPFKHWYAGASACPGVPPDTNVVESYNRSLHDVLGRKPRKLRFLISVGIPLILGMEAPERRDFTKSSIGRVPWFYDRNAKQHAAKLIKQHESGTSVIRDITNLSTSTSSPLYAVRPGGYHSAEVSEEECEARLAALDGHLRTELPQSGHFAGQELDEASAQAGLWIREITRSIRGVHIVQRGNLLESGVAGPDRWRCDCTAFFDTGQCAHVLAVAHLEGLVDVLSAGVDVRRTGGRHAGKRMARVPQPAHGTASKRQRKKQADAKSGVCIGENEEGASAENPVAGKSSQKSRNTRPRDAERGRRDEKGNKH